MKQLMLLLFSAVVTAGARSPGGVKGTELWFQTLPVTADLQGAYRWMDLAGDSVKLRSLDRNGKPGSEYTRPAPSRRHSIFIRHCPFRRKLRKNSFLQVLQLFTGYRLQCLCPASRESRQGYAALFP